MSDLGTALRELAAGAVAPHPADPGGLWKRGRARVARRRAVAAGAAVVLLACVGFSMVLVPTPVVVMPAGPTHAPAFPESVYQPSQWLASTKDEGPLGRLALVYGNYVGKGDRIYGISATSGEYRVLDLPGRVRASLVSISPDGTHVAYWIKGATSGRPYADPRLASQTGPTIGGMAVYDTVTGTTQRLPIRTDHGIQASTMVWLDSRTVAWQDWRMITTTAAHRVGNLTLTLGAEDPVPASAVQSRLLDADRNVDRSWLARRSGDSLVRDNIPSGGRGPVTLPTDLEGIGGQSTIGYAARSGDRLVAVGDGNGDGNAPILIGTVNPDGRVSGMRRVARTVSGALPLGWHDDRTLLLYGGYRNDPDLHLITLDVRSGRTRTVGTVKADSFTGMMPAIDVLRSLVPGDRPPSSEDPRRHRAEIIGGLLGAFAVVGGAGWLLRRRRDQGSVGSSREHHGEA